MLTTNHDRAPHATWCVFTTLIMCMPNMTSGSAACKEHYAQLTFASFSPVSSQLARWKLSRGSFTPAEAYERMKNHVRLLIQVLQEKARSTTIITFFACLFQQYPTVLYVWQCFTAAIIYKKQLDDMCRTCPRFLPQQCPTQTNIWHPAFVLLRCLGLVWGISCLPFWKVLIGKWHPRSHHIWHIRMN